MADALPQLAPPPAPVAVARVETFVLRVPVSVPVRTSFGPMHERPALLVRSAAAMTRAGLLEIDVNDNPLRAEMAPWSLNPAEGAVRLPDGPGIGPAPDLRLLARFTAKI